MGLLSETVHDCALALEQRNSVHSLFLDLAKAFDSVPHYHLLLKEIRGELLDWFQTFLTCYKQRVIINIQKSDWLPAIFGVPQGSVLGPLLFVLYINSLHMFASSMKSGIFVMHITDWLSSYKVAGLDSSSWDCNSASRQFSNMAS